MNRTISHYKTACGRDATIRIIDSYHITCGSPRDATSTLLLIMQNRRPRRTSVGRTTRGSNVPFDWPMRNCFNDTANQNLLKGGHHSYSSQGLDAAFSDLTSFGSHERYFIQSFSLKGRLVAFVLSQASVSTVAWLARGTFSSGSFMQPP